MKTRILCFSFLLITVSLILSSYREGAAQHSGWDCTGAETGLSNPSGCSSGGGCHHSTITTGITVAVELDSAGTPVTQYTAGKTYTVKFAGVNTTASTLPAFGFQLAAIKGSAAQVTPTDAGTWGTAPTNTQISAPQAGNYVLTIFEQATPLTRTTGTGTTGTTYVDSITWTAPVAGTGTVSFWAALNAVNNNGTNDQGDLWNVNHLVITEDTGTTVNGIIPVPLVTGVSVYPNPVNNVLNMQLNNAHAGNCTVSVYNISGQLISIEKMELNEGADNQSINTAAWAPGIYLVSLQTGNTRHQFRVVKQ